MESDIWLVRQMRRPRLTLNIGSDLNPFAFLLGLGGAAMGQVFAYPLSLVLFSCLAPA